MPVPIKIKNEWVQAFIIIEYCKIVGRLSAIIEKKLIYYS